MIGLLSVVPFILFPGVLDWSALQACVASSLLVALTLRWKGKVISIPVLALPWMLWPVLLLALTPAASELFSEQVLRQIVWLLLAIIVWSKLDNEKLARYWVLVASFVIFVLQIIGMAWGQKYLALNSVYAQENVFQFVNMGVMAMAVWTLNWGREIPAGKGLAIIVILLAIASLLYGDTYIQGSWAISAGDCIGVWLGLCSAFLVSLIIWLIQRHVRHRWPLLGFGVIIFLMWVFLPFFLVELPIWNRGMGSSWTSRIDFWRATTKLIWEHWLIGVGNGQFGATIQDYWPTINESLQHAWSFPIAPHNQFLWVWAETGLIGLLIYGFTWAAPWFGVLFKYSLSRERIWLFWIFVLSAFLSAMMILESAQMFFAGQTVAWLVSLYAMRSLSWGNRVCIYISKKWIWLLVPFLLLLVWDRGWQIRSRTLSTPTELNGRVLLEQIVNLNQALEVHGKNAPALYYVAELHRLNGEFAQALAAVDALQSITGTQWPVHRIRAEIYHDMGNDKLACQNAMWPVKHSLQTLDQKLKTDLMCSWE